MAYENTYKMPIVVVHTMNVFGERSLPSKFIPKVIYSIWILICLHLSIYQYISNIYLSTPKVIHSVLEDKEVTIHADSSRTKPGSRRWKYSRYKKIYKPNNIYNIINMSCQVHPRQGRGGRSAVHPFAAPRLQARGRLRWGKVPQVQPGITSLYPYIYFTI